MASTSAAAWLTRLSDLAYRYTGKQLRTRMEGVGRRSNAAGIRNAFVWSATNHGKSKVIFRWSPNSQHLATTGISKVVHILGRVGTEFVLRDQVMPPARSVVIALEWSADGSELAIMQASSSTIMLWQAETGTKRKIDMMQSLGKQLGLLAWAKKGSMMALAGQTALLLYDTGTEKSVRCSVPRGAVTCCDWFKDTYVAFAQDKKEMWICQVNHSGGTGSSSGGVGEVISSIRRRKSSTSPLRRRRQGRSCWP